MCVRQYMRPGNRCSFYPTEDGARQARGGSRVGSRECDGIAKKACNRPRHPRTRLAQFPSRIEKPQSAKERSQNARTAAWRHAAHRKGLWFDDDLWVTTGQPCLNNKSEAAWAPACHWSLRSHTAIMPTVSRNTGFTVGARYGAPRCPSGRNDVAGPESRTPWQGPLS